MRVWAIAACVTLGFVGASSANPLDSPGTVYIDGLPCNLLCQSYMAWSRQTLKANQAAAAGLRNTSGGRAAVEAPRKRMSKRVVPASVDARPQKKTGDPQATITASEPPALPRPKSETAPVGVESRDLRAALTAAPEPQPPAMPATETTTPKVETLEVPRERTPREQVMAALAVAEQITSAETPKADNKTADNKAADNDGADGSKTGDANAASPGGAGALVVLLISRPDVKSASALQGSNIAIDATQSGAEEEIRSALAAAGATETRLSVADASPLDRLAGGDVQAAVLKLVSPSAAEAFPDIKGFKILRVPLSPR